MSNTVRMSSVVNVAKYAPQTSSLIVAVRVRPLLRMECDRGNKRDIIRVLDSKVVVVLDPDEIKDYLDQVQNRTKEKRYTFDIAFSSEATNEDVFYGTVSDLVGGVLQGINTTVFAYGATGSGKTYTMVGTPKDPGLMVQCLRKVFKDRDTIFKGEEFSVTCCYLEVYNEIVYDLLVRNSEALELREDPEAGVQVAGIKRLTVTTADEILDALEEGNRRRKTESTDANQTSSRSHAVLEIEVKRRPTNNHYKVQQLVGKLSLVDLAGSERAAETNNAGQKLRDGANINRSLLALANCINALGKMQGSSKTSYVPYRNSKLTRLLKDGLSGNSRTAMIATVGAAGDQYHHSINTLKYADRAKEIKTHIVQNVGTVESHITDYQKIIDNLQGEVLNLKGQLSDRQQTLKSVPGAGGPRSREDDMLTSIHNLVQEMNENMEERINLQKALFEIEDANVYNQYEIKQLQEIIDSGKGTSREIAEARESHSDLQELLAENETARDRKLADIAANEEDRKNLQKKIDALVNSNQNASFLNLLGTFRLQGLRLQEQKFQMAVRDQIIGEQREVISNLWKIIQKSGMTRDRVLQVPCADCIILDDVLDPPPPQQVARAEGIILDDFLEPAASAAGAQAQALEGERPPTVGASEHLLRRGGSGSRSDSSPEPPPAMRRGKVNTSLIGNRAKLRYRFWSKYEVGDDNNGGDGASSDEESKPAVARFRPRQRPSAGFDDNSPSASPNSNNNHARRSSAIRVHYDAGGHRRRAVSHRVASTAAAIANAAANAAANAPPPYVSSSSTAPAQNSNNATAPPRYTSAVVPNLNNAAAPPPYTSAIVPNLHNNASAPPPYTSSAAHNHNNATTPPPYTSSSNSHADAHNHNNNNGPSPSSMRAVDINNATAPAATSRVKSGRRAGQPQQAESARGPNPRQDPAFLVDLLPPSQLPKPPRSRHRSSDGAGDVEREPSSASRASEVERLRQGMFPYRPSGPDWQDILKVKPPPAPLPPPVPPVQLPLSERLAKIKAAGPRRNSTHDPNNNEADNVGDRLVLPPDALDNEVRRVYPRNMGVV